MANQIIPLSSNPNQKLNLNLSVDGAALTLRLTMRFNEMANYWVATIFDGVGNLLLDSIPFMTGSFPSGNVLRPFGYLKIGSAYLLNNQTTAPLSDYPNASNLGSQFVLLWGDTAA